MKSGFIRGLEIVFFIIEWNGSCFSLSLSLSLSFFFFKFIETVLLCSRIVGWIEIELKSDSERIPGERRKRKPLMIIQVSLKWRISSWFKVETSGNSLFFLRIFQVGKFCTRRFWKRKETKKISRQEIH